MSNHFVPSRRPRCNKLASEPSARSDADTSAEVKLHVTLITFQSGANKPCCTLPPVACQRPEVNYKYSNIFSCVMTFNKGVPACSYGRREGGKTRRRSPGELVWGKSTAGGRREGMKGCWVSSDWIQFPGFPLIRRDKAERRTLNTQARTSLWVHQYDFSNGFCPLDFICQCQRLVTKLTKIPDNSPPPLQALPKHLTDRHANMLEVTYKW